MKMDRVKKYAVHISGAITELLRSSLWRFDYTVKLKIGEYQLK